MWPVDNGNYQLWRLEHQIRPAMADRLLNSVTTTDRAPGVLWLRRLGHLLAKAGKWMSMRRHLGGEAAGMLGRPSHR